MRQGKGQYCEEDDGVINRGAWISGKKTGCIQCVTRQKSISCPYQYLTSATQRAKSKRKSWKAGLRSCRKALEALPASHCAAWASAELFQGSRHAVASAKRKVYVR